MTAYRYKARTKKGAPRFGLVEADNPDEVSRLLARQGLTLETVSEEAPRQIFRLPRLGSRSVAPKALVQFYHQFSALIGAGIPLLRCLESLTGLTSDAELRRAIDEVAKSVRKGSTLADALRKHPQIFNAVAISVLDAAEAGGSIDVAMKRLADYVERTQEIRDNARAAMIYPALIVLVTIGAIITLITFVVPTFESLFAASGVSLPLATRMLVDFADLVTGFWPILMAVLLLTGLGLRTAYALPAIRMMVDRVVLKLPIYGPLVTKIAIARVSRTLASLLVSGVGILDALTSASRTAGNQVIGAAVVQARESVATGVDLRRSLAVHPEIPKLMADMIGVGEESGRLDEMLGKVADFFEREVNTEVQALLKVIEPVLIVIVGIVLAALVVAMYLPIFDMISTVDRL